ncbi:MAG: type II restriction endonuclease, partial [Candidatus Gracilibacteria bacterium]|nr:type II restriction endonuclease [Candidatus Gracilibacteria bacterium]
MQNFNNLISTFTNTIFTWSFYSDFIKIKDNTSFIEEQLNILNFLIGKEEIEDEFLRIVKKYPETRGILPILLAVRHNFGEVLDDETKEIKEVGYLFDENVSLDQNGEKEIINFFVESGLKQVFQHKYITNLNDYVFGIETGLDSNARKNRSGTGMENLVLDFIKDFCSNKGFQYKDQATASWILENWEIKIESDKSARRFDFAIYTGVKVYLFETNFYGGGGSKLKAVAGEFSGLYHFLQNQNIELIWITD